MRWGIVIRDVLIIFVLTAVGGFLIGFFSAQAGISASVALVGMSNIATSVIGFAISGALTRADRLRHLLVVALGVWLLSLVNLAIGVSVVQWILGGLVILLACGIGGGIAALLFRPQPSSEMR